MGEAGVRLPWRWRLGRRRGEWSKTEKGRREESVASTPQRIIFRFLWELDGREEGGYVLGEDSVEPSHSGIACFVGGFCKTLLRCNISPSEGVLRHYVLVPSLHAVVLCTEASSASHPPIELAQRMGSFRPRRQRRETTGYLLSTMHSFLHSPWSERTCSYRDIHWKPLIDLFDDRIL